MVDAKINMTVAQLRKAWDYDASIGAFRWQVHASRKSRKGNLAGSMDNRGYVHLRYKNKSCLAHRAAWAIVHGKWPKGDIDHIDGDKSNNKISNLREASRSQNLVSKPVQTRSASGKKGVYFDKRYGTFRPYIDIEGARRNLGSFASVEEADAVRRAAEIAQWGAFSWPRDAQ